MRIQIDLKKCKKSGQCYYMHPGLIQRGEGNLPVVIGAEVPANMEAAADELLDVCPTGAIDLAD